MDEALSQRLDKETFYPLHGYLGKYEGKMVKAKWTGEYRLPAKGEWYLSGAIIEAYRAPSDFVHPYHIAEIYQVRKVEYWEIVDGS